MDILLVEDEPEVVSFIKKGLEAEQFTVEVARDGLEALSKAEKYLYDIIILDVVLPDRNGFQVCEHLRQNRIDTPIIFLTCKDDLDDRVKGFQVGANDYLTKPFAFEELVSRIRLIFKNSVPQRLTRRLRESSGSLDSGRESEISKHKIMMYSHDTLGLGHIKRSLKIASYLVENYPDTSILLLSGSPLLHEFKLPENFDYIKLPSVRKTGREEYRSRQLKMEFDKIWQVRQSIILSSVEIYKPDIFLVDHSPLGMRSELLETLKYIKLHSPYTRLILGLRDIMDGPEEVLKAWKRQDVLAAFDFLYDHILVYGSQDIFDPLYHYQIPGHLHKKFTFCGYITPLNGVDGEAGQIKQELGASGRPLILVTIGGGDDGFEVLDVFLKSVPLLNQQIDFESLVVSGPFLSSPQKLQIDKACKENKVHFREFVTDLSPYIKASDLVISMAGYNSVTEILRYGSKALLVPRVSPRQEQLLRATLLSERKLVNFIPLSQLNQENLSVALISQLKQKEKPLEAMRQERLLDLEGCVKVGVFLNEILNPLPVNEKN